MIVAKLDAAIKAVCPIHGVSIGRKDDKATWRIDFKDEATVQQRTDAQALLDAFDVAAAEAEKPARVQSLEERVMISKRLATKADFDAEAAK